jgi:hypothetical protein
MATFNPDPDKTGDFLKPNFGTAPSFFGFKPDMSPVYKFLDTVQDPLIKKNAEDFKVAWSAFNAAITIPPEVSSVLATVNSTLSTIEAVNNALIAVLDTLLPFAEFNLNLLEAVIQGILLLIGRLVELLNPKVSVHALVIPPRLGNTKSITSNSENRLVRTAESLQNIKESSIELLNTSLKAVPSLSSLQLVSRTGPGYLLDTITSKISDLADPNRPLLRSASHYAGVGLFIGASNITEILSQWSKIVQVLGLVGANFQDKSLPPEPTVTGPRRIFSTDTLDNMVVYPVLPGTALGIASIRRDSTWTFIARYELVTNKLVTKNELTSLELTTASLLANPSNLELLVTSPQATVGEFNTVHITSTKPLLSRYSPQHTWNLTSAGTIGLCCIDIYTIKVDDKEVYVARKSKAVECQFDPSFTGLVKYEGRVDYRGAPAAISPKWLSASGTLTLLPPVFASLVTVIELVSSWLSALTASALNIFKTIVDTLKASLKVIAQILDLIQDFTTLVAQILSVNLSCSGITFAGEGGTTSLVNLFQQYFTNSGSPSNFGTNGVDLTASSSQLTAELASAVSTSENPTALDRRAGEILDAQTRARKQREAEIDATLSSNSFYTADAGKVSPTFDAKDTTAGVVILAYSEVAANVQAARVLFDLLLNAASPSSNDKTTTEEAVSSQANIPIELLSSLPANLAITEAISNSPVFFGENMLPVSSEDQSPFKFCP